ncbi:MAG: hypothetical protein AAF413_02635 [Patescibacteria group bacterium]
MHEPQIELYSERSTRRDNSPEKGYRPLHVSEHVIQAGRDMVAREPMRRIGAYYPGFNPAINQWRRLHIYAALPEALATSQVFSSVDQTGSKELRLEQVVYDYKYYDHPLGFPDLATGQTYNHSSIPWVYAVNSDNHYSPWFEERQNALAVDPDSEFWMRISDTTMLPTSCVLRLEGDQQLTGFCARFIAHNGLHLENGLIDIKPGDIYCSPADSLLWRINLAARISGFEVNLDISPQEHRDRVATHIASVLSRLLDGEDRLIEASELREKIAESGEPLNPFGGNMDHFTYVTSSEMGNLHRFLTREWSFVLQNTVEMYQIDPEFILEIAFERWLAHCYLMEHALQPGWSKMCSSGLDLKGAQKFVIDRPPEMIERYRELMQEIVGTAIDQTFVRDIVVADRGGSDHLRRGFGDALARLNSARSS